MDLFDKIESTFKTKYDGWEGSDQFTGTSFRLRRMVSEMCWDNEKIIEEVTGCFKAVYDHKFSEMLVSQGTSVWTLCPHHILPCQFEVSVGYIPNGKVLGLSKFSRVANILGKRPIMQEQYSSELARVIMDNLKPKGVGVYVVGRHGCMNCRGVLQDTKVHTSVLKGCFLDDVGVKEEFFRMLGLNGRT